LGAAREADHRYVAMAIEHSALASRCRHGCPRDFTKDRDAQSRRALHLRTTRQSHSHLPKTNRIFVGRLDARESRRSIKESLKPFRNSSLQKPMSIWLRQGLSRFLYLAKLSATDVTDDWLKKA
jgi:hypothetical protein